MNDLYLIGNGFDLAHGLKTSYNDFLLWYLNDSLQICNSKSFFNDRLITIKRNGYQYSSLVSYESVNEMLVDMKKMNFSIDYSHYFFKNLVENYRGNKWVDIEYEYYTALVVHYSEIELNPQSNDSAIKAVMRLNFCFNEIKKKLEEYLTTIKIDIYLKHMLIENILTEGNGPKKEDFAEKLFLYFNYTPTLELYSKEFIIHQSKIIYIHGKLIDEDNPIIFGYGDEMDPHYEKVENLNNNEFLRNIKSFGYFRTSNYQRVNSFINGEGKEFTVKILGHSCGLSDRILLNTIFEHPNCKAIKIYYYQKSETENDYFEKTQEISRHFKASGKGNMRTKIVPFSQSVPLLPFVPKN